jgi:hypothetical protein
MAACRHRSSHDPRRSLGARSPDHVRAASRPVVTVERRPAGVIRRHAPTGPTVASSTPRLDEDERRLVALWEYESKDGAAHTESADDAVAALFSSSLGGAPRTDVRPAASRTRRSATRPAGQRSHARPRPHRQPAPRRLRGVGAVVAAALHVAFAIPGAFTGAPDSATDQIRHRASRTDVPLAAQEPSPAEREAARSQRTRQRRNNPAETVQQTDEVRRDRVRASRSHRDSTARARSRRRTGRPADVTALPPPPPASRQVTPPTPLSSACDEFPPC